MDPLTWPAFVDGSQPVALSATDATHPFSSAWGGAQTLAYQLTDGKVISAGPQSMDSYLGPTIVVPRGTSTRVAVTNEITAHPLANSLDPAIHGTVADDANRGRVAVHLHGGNSAPAHDGDPWDTFLPPATRQYQYDNGQDAAGLWYHDHALGLTRLNVYAGLGASYLIRDTPATGIDTGDGGALPAPPYEIPLVIQDKTFQADGTLFYPPAPWAPEFFGNTAVVNGTAYPYLDAARGVYRFRVYNGSNARFYRLQLKVGSSGGALSFWQIGTDGGLLDAPVVLDNLVLAPAERADLLIDFSALDVGEVVEMTNDAPAPFPNGSSDEAPVRNIMQFRVSGARGWNPAQPIASMNLRPITPVTRLDKLASSAPVRTHSLVEVSDAQDNVLTVTLNNRMFDALDYASAPITPGTLEVWELVNTTEDAHPIHLHLVQFQLLNRQPFDAAGYLAQHYINSIGLIDLGSGPYPAPSPAPFLTGQVESPAANERGWKDTVHLPPGKVTRIVVPFGAVKDIPVAAPTVYSGDYVWHCHILEHEDNDMMQRYRIA